jgi:oxygen-independent coproporphyrinogen-3 oxidase
MKDWLRLEDHYGESFEEEVLTIEERYNEYVMTSLRTIWGCDVAIVRQEFGEEFVGKLLDGADRYIQDHSLMFKGSRLYLTNKGKLFADGIAAELFA